ncbi:MAG: SET domain-containing protein-lysine N-methyltransferase, partial [Anaerolineae bacterium]|nr:SET domain-containing protein-lysine N-methyltransferase [Anaerolineae bacterium]
LMQPSWLNPRIEIRSTPAAGKGMFAKEMICAGEKVLVFGGLYADSAGADEAIRAGKGVMQWDDDLWSIETESDDPVYLINHACQPNVWMADAYTLVARADIAPDAEITADYALWEADETYVASWECHCGAPDCRGRITGKDWRLPRLQQAYAGHFSPLLNRRIQNLG